MQPDEILHFWYHECDESDWFTRSAQLDATIAERFSDIHAQAAAGELAHWRIAPQGRLAEVLILDQFSRNLFRDDARAFAYDNMALVLTQEAIHSGDDKALEVKERWFLYLPFMHSESAIIHEQAVTLFTDLGIETVLDFEWKHKKIIDRFGRYPHRNAVLGRASTPEEQAFLNEPDSSF